MIPDTSLMFHSPYNTQQLGPVPGTFLGKVIHYLWNVITVPSYESVGSTIYYGLCTHCSTRHLSDMCLTFCHVCNVKGRHKLDTT